MSHFQVVLLNKYDVNGFLLNFGIEDEVESHDFFYRKLQLSTIEDWGDDIDGSKRNDCSFTSCAVNV